MEIPSQTKPAIWGAVGGAVAIAVLGFTWGGWSTASSSERMAKLRGENAVVAALSPICVSNFQKQPNADAALAVKEQRLRKEADERAGGATVPSKNLP